MEHILKLRDALQARGISIYRLHKMTGIRYELLRRSFSSKRDLRVGELILILEKSGIAFDQIQ